MLSQEALQEAIQQATKSAGVCTRFCQVGARLDEQTYACWHNGTGPRDTDSPRVHANPTLTMNTEQLAAHLAAWLRGLHGHGDRRDLNAAMSDVRGCEACTTWTTAGQPAFQRLQLVGESGPELFYAPTDGLVVPGVPT